MRMGIVGKKIGMTQYFTDSGALVPVTVLDVSDCYISQIKSAESDGYNAIQVAYGSKKQQNVIKAKAGVFKKSELAPKAHFKEIRLDSSDNVSHLKVGQKLVPTMFQVGDKVDVIGFSKGRGFQGVVKRHGFHGADASHGVHEYFRHGGSNGSNTFPGRTLKNKGMPGRMGNEKRTIQKIQVVKVDGEKGLIFVKGSVPGFHSKYVLIRSAKKASRPDSRSWVAA